jgi:hypothetical protein
MGRGPLQLAHLPTFAKFAAAMTMPVIPKDGETANRDATLTLINGGTRQTETSPHPLISPTISP